MSLTSLCPATCRSGGSGQQQQAWEGGGSAAGRLQRLQGRQQALGRGGAREEGDEEEDAVVVVGTHSRAAVDSDGQLALEALPEEGVTEEQLGRRLPGEESPGALCSLLSVLCCRTVCLLV